MKTIALILIARLVVELTKNTKAIKTENKNTIIHPAEFMMRAEY